VTSIADLGHGDVRLWARYRAARFRSWLLKRGRRVLPEYEAERSTWWALLRRTILLAGLCFVTFFYGLLVSILPPFMLIPAAVPPVVLALLVVWALPEAPNPPVRILTGVFLVFSVVLYLWPNYLALSVGGLPWISIRRLMGVAAVLLLLICVSTSARFRSELGAVLRSSPWLTRMMIAFVSIQFISIAFSSGPGAAINRMVDMQTTWTAMFFISAWYGGKAERNIKIWVNLIMVVAVGLMILGAVEYRVQHVLWAGYIPSFLQIQDPAVLEILTANFRDRYRVVATLTSPLSYGEFLAMVTPFFIYRLFNAKTMLGFVLWGAMDVILLVSCFFSGARLSMIGYIVAHVVYVFLWAARYWRTHPGGLIGPALTLSYPALTALLGLAIMVVPAVHNRVLGGGSTQFSNNARHEQFALAVPAIAKRPLFGYGPGGSGGAIGWFNPAGEISVDSGYLTIAADYGLLGFLSFFGMIVLLGIQAGYMSIFARGKGVPLAAAVCAIFATIMSTKLVLSQMDNFPLLYIVLGLSAAVIYHGKRDALKNAG
jgi:O-antigen ligase